MPNQLTISERERASLRGAELVGFVAERLARSGSAAAGGAAASEVWEVWLQAVEAGDDQRMAELGLAPVRDLWQLRVPLPCPLPAPYQPVSTRQFQPDDLDGFLSANAAAFAWHPEQGDLDSAQFHEQTQQSWYDEAGFRILELDGELAGYCWTKIHADHDPPLGEIYVIAVDPRYAGRGLGAPLTHAGLEHMAGRGIETGMLYVESDNAPAVKIYAKLGFKLHQVNRLYVSGAG